MAVVLTVTVDSYDYGFDFVDSRIDIDASLDSVNVNKLWDAIQEAMAHEQGVIYDVIATAEGTTTLSAGIATFLTVSLQDQWEINTLKSSGKFQVEGGNLVRADEEDPFRDNPLITYINNLSQAGIIATVATGSGLSSEQDAAISAIKAKTDSLTFTRSGNVDANIQYVNDVAVTGTGAEGDRWGP